MTPREKAIELVNKYWITDFNIYEKESKQCALIAVDELIDANKKCSYTIDYTNTLHAKDLDAKVRSEIELFFIYWESVKQEIKNL